MIGGDSTRRSFPESLDADALGVSARGLMAAFRPSDGWVALVLLAANLCTVVVSVERADWAPTPSLVSVLLLGMLTAFVLHRLPFWPGLAILPGLVLGGVTVTWQLANFSFDGQELGGASVLLERLMLWVEAAGSDSISIDKAPFAFVLVSAAWLLGYVGAWVFLRHRNFWGVFVLSGLGLFSNLTFLPPNTILLLSLYLFTALLLVARVQAVRRQSQWDRRGISYDEELHSLSLSDSFFLAIAIIVIAVLLPSGGAWSSATNAYESLRKPLMGLEDEFNRLFAGLPARREIGFRVWDDVMAFQGTINPGTTNTVLVESPLPMYWKARTYDTYTGKGWTSKHTEYRPLDYTPEFADVGHQQTRISVRYAVTPLYPSPYLFAGPRVTDVDRDVEMETPSVPLFRVDTLLYDPLAYFPQPLPEIGRALTERVRENPAATEAELQQLLPPTFRVHEIQQREGGISAIIIAEALPDPPEVLAVRSGSGVFGARDTYTVTSSVIAVEPEQLREAGTVYPAHISQRHMQLSRDLPERVRILADELTASGETPYDKALRVESFLKSLTYDLEIEPPPFDADGVDHFLFDQQRGYSEYFASAMAVMLRSVGVPARVAAGYTTGVPLEEPDIYAVTDSNSHAWVEVYFPGYSWISFEPTPGADLPDAMIPGGIVGTSIESRLGARFNFDCLDIFDLECGVPLEGLPTGDFSLVETTEGSGVAPWVWLAILAGLPALMLAVACWVYWRFIAAPYEPAAIFARMQSLAALSGLARGSPTRTPYQFGQRLGQLVPEQRERVNFIVESYVLSHYGGRSLSEDQKSQLRRAWRRLRFTLITESIGQRIFPRSDL